MKIAIHHRKNSFSSHWIEYCNENNIDYKIVDCYSNDIINQLADCEAFMWHFHHINPKDVLFAKQLLYSLQMAGKVVFPNFNTAWHFDDKLGQKYLLEAIDAPLVSSYIFYDEVKALEWIQETQFPKVFKLRKGSGSSHVKLVKDKNSARKLVKKAFGKGFANYDAVSKLKESLRKYRTGQVRFISVVKAAVRLLYPTKFSRIVGKERSYIYFQDFIPNNTYDMRIHVVSNKCFACIRSVRPGDFRASGSGIISYDFSKIPLLAIQRAFEIANKLDLQSVAFDFIMKDKNPLLVEMSYGFGVDPTDFDYGYWNKDLEFIPEKFNPFGWMIELVLQECREYHKKSEVLD